MRNLPGFFWSAFLIFFFVFELRRPVFTSIRVYHGFLQLSFSFTTRKTEKLGWRGARLNPSKGEHRAKGGGHEGTARGESARGSRPRIPRE